MNGYEENWRKYKRVRNTYMALFALLVPVCFGIGVAASKLFGTFTPGFVAAFVWWALLYFTGMRLILWRCPNCGKRFSGKWWYNLGFLARCCVHCGLRKYSNAPPNASTAP